MITHLKRVLEHLKTFEPLKLCSVPDGYEAILIADLARSIACQPGANAAALVFVARDGRRQALIENAFSFVAPDIEILSFPNWDCQPYDRVSPHAAIVALVGVWLRVTSCRTMSTICTGHPGLSNRSSACA